MNKLLPRYRALDAADGDSAEVVRKYADRILYIHHKDYKNGNVLPLGEGEVDFEGILEALRAHNYDG